MTDAELARQLAEQGDVPVPLFEIPKPPPAKPILTPRQLEVLALIAGGASTHRIGSHLEVAEATIKTHLRNAGRATGHLGRCELLAWCFRTGHLRWAGQCVVADPLPEPRMFLLLGRWLPVERAVGEVEALLARAA